MQPALTLSERANGFPSVLHLSMSSLVKISWLQNLLHYPIKLAGRIAFCCLCLGGGGGVLVCCVEL